MRRIIPFLAALTFFVLFLRLGYWQLDRASYKDELALSDQQRRDAPPSPLETLSGGPQALLYRQTLAEGRYDADHQFLLDNRTHQSRVGYHVLSPMRLADGSGVLVNRGWLPLGASRQALPDIGIEQPQQHIKGRINRLPEIAVLSAVADPQPKNWPVVVLAAERDWMSQVLGYPLRPYLIELDQDATQGYVREWKAVVGMGADSHRGYAFQWFGLAAAVLVVALILSSRPWWKKKHD